MLDVSSWQNNAQQIKLSVCVYAVSDGWKVPVRVSKETWKVSKLDQIMEYE